MSVTIPTPDLYLPLTSQPTNSTLGLKTSTTAPSYDSNNGLVFDDLYSKPGAGPVWGSSKFLNIPCTAPTPPTSSTPTGITVCFCMNLNQYFPGTSIHVLTMGKKSAVGTLPNTESITLYYDSRKRLSMTLSVPSGGTVPNNGNVLMTGYNESNTLALTSNTWFFVAFTISLTSSSVQSISLYLGNSIKNVVGLSNGKNNSGFGQNNIGTNINLNPTTPNLLYNDIQIGDRFQNLNNFNNTGYGLNGCIRDFMIFRRPLTLDQLRAMSSRLPAPGAPFPSTATAKPIPTINPTFPLYSALQSLIHYIPPTIISLPLTSKPTIGTTSGSITHNTSGAVFSNNSTPTLNGTTSNSYINIPVPTSGKTITNNKFTVSFPVYLNYLNNKPLDILTLGNNGTTNEALSIISQYVENTGNQNVSNTTCSTTNAKRYYIGAVVNNTGVNENTVINENEPPSSASILLRSVNGVNATGEKYSNYNGTSFRRGISQFSANDTVTVFYDPTNKFKIYPGTNISSDFFTNSNTNPEFYKGKSIFGSYITAPTTIVSVTKRNYNPDTAFNSCDSYEIKITPPFVGIPPDSTSSSLIYYVNSLPTSTTITNKYKGAQHPVDECTWNLVSLVLDGINVSLYINNNLCTTVAIPTGFNFNTFRIGDSFANNSKAFVGTIKNFMVWNIPFNTSFGNPITYPNIMELRNIYILNTPTVTAALHFDQDDIPLLENDIPLLEENITETFLNLKSKNKFVTMSRLFSIAGLLFYAIGLISNMNYDEVIKNKNVSFALNVLLVISIVVSITN